MQLAIDLQVAQSPDSGHRGLGRYSVEMTRALLNAGAPIGAITTNPALPSRALPDDIVASGLVRPNTLETFRELRRRAPLAYHVMSPMEEPNFVEVAMPRFTRSADATVMVVYDLIPYLFDDPYLRQVDRREAHVGRLRRIRQADLFLAISECTRRDFIEHLSIEPDRIFTVGTGVSEVFRPALAGDDSFAAVRQAVPTITRPYVLTVPAFEWRKNAELLIRAFARLAPDVRAAHQLVIACAVPPHGLAAWQALADELGLREHELVITGFVGDELLRSLYQAATLHVFPSKYEGFGLPVAEAAACGTPSITSRAGSLPEVLDFAPSTFDPYDADELAALIARALADTRFLDELRDAARRSVQRNTWARVAERTLAAYQTLSTPSIPRSRRAMVAGSAIVTPLPPVPSGVATYTARVLDRWPGDAPLDVFAEAVPAGGWRRVRSARRQFPAAALGTTVFPYDYDRRLHVLGSSRYHVEAYELALRHPSAVWLHEADLMGLILAWAERVRYEESYGWRGERRRRSLNEIIGSHLGDMYPQLALPDGELSYEALLGIGVGGAAQVVARSSQVVVNSERARTRLLADLALSRFTERPPIAVVPHAVPERSFDESPREPIIVCFGFTVARKQPGLIIEAVAAVGGELQLVFAGGMPQAMVDGIAGHAAHHGIAERVTVTGYLDDTAYDGWLRRGAVAVQLRDRDFGESTGTVHDAISAGLPVITNIASCRELPEGTVRNVAPTVTALELAAELDALVYSDAQRRSMRAAMRDYAARWTFDHVGDAVSSLLRD